MSINGTGSSPRPPHQDRTRKSASRLYIYIFTSQFPAATHKPRTYTKMGDMPRKKLHAIMISLPFQGHINPFVSLALKLASRGIVVTFAHLEFVHCRLSKSHAAVDFFVRARESGLEIRYTTIGDGLDPLEYDRDVHLEEYWELMRRDFPSRVDDFVGKTIESDPDSIHFLVTDTIYEWPAVVAEKYSLVNVSFFTQPALVFCLAYHWDLLEENGHCQFTDGIDEEINYIPGVKSMNTKDLMSFVKEPLEASIINRSVFRAFEAVKKADFILHNTVQELESETLSALNEYHQPNYAIGPVNFLKDLPTSTVITSLWSESDCADWLESKSPGSVLYVSFGSFVHASKESLTEMAYGLLLSGVNFVWVIREGLMRCGDANANTLPEGYEEEIKGKGLIIPWCNQVKILSNPAIGGFLTHNGWNSTIESIWCGVPMICYPVTYDQPTNRKLVVDDWKIGTDLCDHGRRDIVREEVAAQIKGFMSTGNGWRRKAKQVKNVVQKALGTDGSSERNFEQFIEDLKVKLSLMITSECVLAT